MSVIYSFATTEELNTYYAESLNNSSIIPVNTGCLYYVYKHISEDSIALEAIKQYSKGHINTLDFERIINMPISDSEEYFKTEEYVDRTLLKLSQVRKKFHTRNKTGLRK